MKKFLLFLVFALFTYGVNAQIQDVCTVLVTVDCEGDGIIDFQGVVDCEYADAYAQQLVASCGHQQ